MKLLRCVLSASGLVIASALSAASSGRLPDPNEWTPDATIVSKVDAQVLSLDFPEAEGGSIAAYSRYYYGTARKGHRLIEGVLLAHGWAISIAEPATSGIHIVPENKMPRIADGGCDQVNVEFDVETGKLDAYCNASLAPPPPPPQNSN